MIALVAAHLVVAAFAPLLVRRLGARAFYVLAIVPAITTGYAVWRYPQATSADPPTESIAWVRGLGVSLALRMDSLAWVMTLVVCGIGTLILLYSAHYFDPKAEPRLGLFAASLTAFAGVMLGLVLADDLVAMFVFWEATTVLSYLLIGFRTTSLASVGAAKQALVVTTAGGLAMLVGIVIIGSVAGTYRISALPSGPGEGPAITVAVVLLLAGALTKSAQVPFHFWLPGAMAAPTPVSAYLHAASMVKAGVYLIARFAPLYADLLTWQVIVIVVGSATMLLGAYRSLRQYDLKLVLAYGTVSQLGFLTLLVGSAGYSLMLAGLAVLVAHALFKSALFLTVGAIDHAYGTRDLRRLHTVRGDLPLLAVAATVAAMSMAGLPPMLGFAAKEAAITGSLNPDGTLAWIRWIAVVVGSILTFAYSARFLWGAFTRKDPSRFVHPQDCSDAPLHHRPGPLLVAVPVVLSLVTVVMGPGSASLEHAIDPFLAAWTPGDYPAHLGLWHGFGAALVTSVAIWAVGALMVVGQRRIAHVQARIPHAPDAGRIYQQLTRGLDHLAVEVTGATNRGSTPQLLATILVVFVTIPAVELLRGRDLTWPTQVRLWDSPAQVGIALVTILAALLATRARRRLRAVFLVSVTGYGAALLFLLHGAPDLALTQILVETISLVVFVLVLRRLSGRFPDIAGGRARAARAALGGAVGLTLSLVAISVGSARTQLPAAQGLEDRAPEMGGGYNIVNVILVDVRAWDTMGELSVVLAAATGVASLVFLRGERIQGARRRLAETRSERVSAAADTSGGQWISAATDGSGRTVILEVVTRLVFHVIMLWSVYLLLTGHNAPGGGFAAGLVAGLGLTLRYLAGRARELHVAAPVLPAHLLGSGLAIATLSAVVPMAFGQPALYSWVADVHIPILGSVHLVSSLAFDIGVYLVVVGLVLDILRSLGASLDQSTEAAAAPAEGGAR